MIVYLSSSLLINMPLPLSAVIQQHIQQWHQSAAAVVHLVKSAIALYTSSEYWSQPYHTSKLTGEEWVWELIHGHPNWIYTELGVHLYVFLTLCYDRTTSLTQTRWTASFPFSLSLTP